MNHYLLGVDWSETEIRIACLKREGQKFHLVKFDQLTISPADAKAASENLSQWVKNNLPADASINLSLALSESTIFLNEVKLPKLKDQALAEAIFWEISSLITIPQEEAIIQWKKISETAKQTNLTAFAVRSQVIQNILNLFSVAGLRVETIEPSSCAFTRLAKGKLERSSLLIVLKEEETDFIVLKNGVPIFANSVSLLLKSMKAKKRKLGQEAISILTANTRKVISFCESKNKEKIQQVFLAGPGVRYSGLAQAINSFNHLPVNFARIKPDPRLIIGKQSLRTISRYFISLGVALKPTTLGPEEVNLLPEKEFKFLKEEKNQQRTFKQVKVFTALTAIFLLVNLLFIFGVKIWRKSLEKQISLTKPFVNNHPAQKLVPQIQTTNNLLVQINLLMANQKDTGKHLKDLSQLVPADLRLVSLDFTSLPKEQWKISGIGDREDILAFYERLKIDSGFKQITIPYSSLQKAKNSEFKIILE